MWGASGKARAAWFFARWRRQQWLRQRCRRLSQRLRRRLLSATELAGLERLAAAQDDAEGSQEAKLEALQILVAGICRLGDPNLVVAL